MPDTMGGHQSIPAGRKDLESELCAIDAEIASLEAQNDGLLVIQIMVLLGRKEYLEQILPNIAATEAQQQVLSH
jgi:hypothetical protein